MRATTTTPGPQDDTAVVEFDVIVHGTGRMEDHAQAAYWTEVPAAAACMAEGSGIDEVLDNTEAAIIRWLRWTRGEAPPVRLRPDLAF